MLLETAEELTQLALAVAAMYLGMRLVLRIQQSRWSAHVERRRAAVMGLLTLVAAAVMMGEDTLKGQSGPVDTAILLWLRQHMPMALVPGFEAVTFTASSTVLTPLTIMPKEKDGNAFFVVADPYACKCLYVGDQKAYDSYQKLALKQEYAEDNLEAAEMNEDAAMDWGMWGPWGAWY